MQQGDGQFDPFPLAVVVEGGQGEARVGTDRDLHPWPGRPQLADDPLEDGDDSLAGMGIARAEDGGDQLVGVAIEDERGWYMCWR